jgi:hypothetical protein
MMSPIRSFVNVSYREKSFRGDVWGVFLGEVWGVVGRSNSSCGGSSGGGSWGGWGEMDGWGVNSQVYSCSWSSSGANLTDRDFNSPELLSELVIEWVMCWVSFLAVRKDVSVESGGVFEPRAE